MIFKIILCQQNVRYIVFFDSKKKTRNGISKSLFYSFVTHFLQFLCLVSCKLQHIKDNEFQKYNIKSIFSELQESQQKRKLTRGITQMLFIKDENASSNVMFFTVIERNRFKQTLEKHLFKKNKRQLEKKNCILKQW